MAARLRSEALAYWYGQSSDYYATGLDVLAFEAAAAEAESPPSTIPSSFSTNPWTVDSATFHPFPTR